MIKLKGQFVDAAKRLQKDTAEKLGESEYALYEVHNTARSRRAATVEILTDLCGTENHIQVDKSMNVDYRYHWQDSLV